MRKYAHGKVLKNESALKNYVMSTRKKLIWCAKYSPKLTAHHYYIVLTLCNLFLSYYVTNVVFVKIVNKKLINLREEATMKIHSPVLEFVRNKLRKLHLMMIFRRVKVRKLWEKFNFLNKIMKNYFLKLSHCFHWPNPFTFSFFTEFKNWFLSLFNAKFQQSEQQMTGRNPLAKNDKIMWLHLFVTFNFCSLLKAYEPRESDLVNFFDTQWLN
jgi:hypothetical protein